MTPAEIEQHAATLKAAATRLRPSSTARDLDAAAALLCLLPALVVQEDGRPAAKALVSALARVSRAQKCLRAALAHADAAERWLRSEVQDVMDELQDQRIEATPPRTAAVVDALRAAMRAAVDRMPGGPTD